MGGRRENTISLLLLDSECECQTVDSTNSRNMKDINDVCPCPVASSRCRWRVVAAASSVRISVSSVRIVCLSSVRIVWFLRTFPFSGVNRTEARKAGLQFLCVLFWREAKFPAKLRSSSLRHRLPRRSTIDESMTTMMTMTVW
jgi:hypothetical protein